MPEIAKTVSALRAAVSRRRAGKAAPVALVPTMGALHAGHLALVEAARENAGHVIVSIFVNPRQFAPSEDFGEYPRTLEADLAKLRDHAVDIAFLPQPGEMYGDDFATEVVVGGPAEGLESESRPHFFRGVATVVTKLLLQCLPDYAIFGEKDYQQLLVVRRLVRDLDIPVAVIGVPTVREGDGLALSSRNVYLSPSERALAPSLHRELQAAAERIRAGTAPRTAVEKARQNLSDLGFEVDYFAARNAETLAPLTSSHEPVRLLVAARLGTTRLIDNIGV